MDNMLKAIAEMSNEEQTKAFNELESKLGTEITNALRERVFLIKICNNREFYNDAAILLGNRVYNRLTK